jgi:hypothetical protein
VQAHARYLTCGTPAADSTRLLDADVLDGGGYTWTAPGLGEVRDFRPNFTTTNTRLIGYRKGTETWGQLTTFAQLLPTALARPAATTAAFPSPFGAELSVTFQVARPQPVALELRDALGRLVRTRPLAPQAAGNGTVSLATAGLPTGFYTAHLLLPEERRTEVLKVLKAD